MSGLNSCQFIGNLTKPAELRYTQTQQPVVSMRIAVNGSYYSNGERKERAPQYFQVVMWGKRGEALVRKECLLKGQRIRVHGRMENRSWTKQDGTTGYTTELTVGSTDEDFMLLGRSGSQANGAPEDLPPPPETQDDFAE